MFSSIKVGVIVNRPLVAVSGVRMTLFSSFDSSVCSFTVSFWSLPYFVAASVAPSTGFFRLSCQPMISATRKALSFSRSLFSDVGLHRVGLRDERVVVVGEEEVGVRHALPA